VFDDAFWVGGGRAVKRRGETLGREAAHFFLRFGCSGMSMFARCVSG
jgi:hypothetical protein